MKLTLVLLTLDELPGLTALFDRIPFDAVDEAFAVDGGSTDGTCEFLAERSFRVIPQGPPGRGEAFRVAFREARGDALIFFSPDGNEDPSDIPRFRPLLEGGADMVIATRMVREARNEEDDQLLKWRKWVNQAFTIMANATWNRGPRVSDTINGFRAIRADAWRTIALDGPGYTIEYQSSIRCFKKGLKIAEFPTREGNRIGPEKQSPSLQTGLAFVRLYLRELRLGRRWEALPHPQAPPAEDPAPDR